MRLDLVITARQRRHAARRLADTAPRAVLLLALMAMLAGCATAPRTEPGGSGSTAPIPANREPPPPNVNLSGFPLQYRQGYADGCASAGGAERKDTARFGNDGNYRTGWQDGLAICRKH